MRIKHEICRTPSTRIATDVNRGRLGWSKALGTHRPFLSYNLDELDQSDQVGPEGAGCVVHLPVLDLVEKVKTAAWVDEELAGRPERVAHVEALLAPAEALFQHILARYGQPVEDVAAVSSSHLGPHVAKPRPDRGSAASPDQFVEVRPGLHQLPEAALALGRRTRHVTPIAQHPAVEVDLVPVEGWRQGVGQRREHPVLLPRVERVTACR